MNCSTSVCTESNPMWRPNTCHIESIFNLLSTDLYSSEHCLNMYLSASPSVILNHHCGAGITTWGGRSISGWISHVFLAYKEFVRKMETAGASDLYGKRDNWLAWYCFFTSWRSAHLSTLMMELIIGLLAHDLAKRCWMPISPCSFNLILCLLNHLIK